MRRPRLFVIAMLLAGFAAPAFAQKVVKEGDQAPDFDAPNFMNFDGSISSQRMRGKIIVLIFWRTTDSTSVDAVPTLNSIYDRYRKRGVVLMAFTPETDKEAVERTVKGKDVHFVVAWGGNVDDLFNVTAFPQAFIIDTHGTLTWKGHPADDLEEKIKDQIKKSPPVGSDPEEQRKRLAAAQSAFTAKQFGRAFTYARDVIDLTDNGTPQYEAIKKMLEEIEKGAREQLTEARSAVTAKDFEKACSIFAELSVRFSGHEIGKQADDEAAKLEADSESKPKIKKAVANAKGVFRNEQAADAEGMKQYLEASDIYREVMTKYTDTDAATAAKAALDRLTADPSIQTAMTEAEAGREADRWFDIGERCVRVKLNDMARKYFEKVVQTYPKTAAADKARKRLETLPKDEPEPAAKSEKAEKPPAPEDKTVKAAKPEPKKGG